MHYPVLTNEEMEKLRHIAQPGFRSVTLPILFPVADGTAGLAPALERVVRGGRPGHQGGGEHSGVVRPRPERDARPIPALLAWRGCIII